MQLRRALIALLIAGAASAAGYTMANWQALEGVFGAVELKLIDYRVRSAMKTNPDSVPVVLVLFDSEVIATLPYLVPFPRAVLADLINGVSAAGAKAIGLDVFLDRQYPELNRIDDGDAKLRAAIERAGNVVIGALTTGNDSARVLMAPDTFFSKVSAGVGSTDLPTPFETIRDGTLTVKTTD